MPDLYKSKAFLQKRYQREGKTAKQIAQECNTTEMTITRWLIHFGLMRNPRTWSRK